MTGPVLRMRGALSSAWRPCLAYLDSGFVAGCFFWEIGSLQYGRGTFLWCGECEGGRRMVWWSRVWGGSINAGSMAAEASRVTLWSSLIDYGLLVYALRMKSKGVLATRRYGAISVRKSA